MASISGIGILHNLRLSGIINPSRNIPTFLGIFSRLSTGLGNLWDGLLLAVPKKKVSLRRRRNRQLGPAAKHHPRRTNLNRCPSCGGVKLMHTLCTNCVQEIQNEWKAATLPQVKPNQNAAPRSVQERIDEKINFPQPVLKKGGSLDRKQGKDWVYKRPKPLDFK